MKLNREWCIGWQQILIILWIAKADGACSSIRLGYSAITQPYSAIPRPYSTILLE